MSNRTPMTTVVRLSQGDQLGTTMKRLRIWLDGERIEPREFKTVADAAGYTFTIGFRRPQDAKRFRAQFGA
ncbi:MAG TPA: hypothetical protein VFQ90_03995 [Stellaceae bacterium]|jgi:hypothetical protein|nr:hypothetical protein [Stellaceae bacterium]